MKAKTGADLVVMIINDKIIDRRAVQQAHSLRQAGLRVEFVAWKFGDDDPIEVDGFPIRRIDFGAYQEQVFHLANEGLLLYPRESLLGLSIDASARLTGLSNSKAANPGVADKVVRKAISAVRFGVVKGLSFASRASAKVLVRPYRALQSSAGRVLVRRIAMAAAHSKLHNLYSRGKVYAVQSHDLDTAWLGLTLAHSLRVPFVFDSHELFLEQQGLDPAFRAYYAKVQPKAIRRAAFWMIVNDLAGEWLVEDYRKKGITVPEPLVIQNSVPYWKKVGHEHALRQAAGIPAGKRIALFQGGLSALRNLENVVRIARHLQTGWVITFLGDGPELAKLKAEAGDLLGDKVFFVPAVPQEELLRYTASADVGLIPYTGVDKNTYYASPNKLYEYFQAGLPIVANDIPFVKKKLTSAGSGVVGNFEDPQAIARILDALDDAALAKLQTAAAAAKEVECWEIESQPYVARYLALRDGRPAASGLPLQPRLG